MVKNFHIRNFHFALFYSNLVQSILFILLTKIRIIEKLETVLISLVYCRTRWQVYKTKFWFKNRPKWLIVCSFDYKVIALFLGALWFSITNQLIAKWNMSSDWSQIWENCLADLSSCPAVNKWNQDCYASLNLIRFRLRG